MSASETQEQLWALPGAQYHHRIIDLRTQLKSLVSEPNEWMWAIFTQWLGIQTPHIWQIENSLDLCQGLDIFIIEKMGSGKSALTLTPVIAHWLRKELHIAIVIYPMEALISDQVSEEFCGEWKIYQYTHIVLRRGRHDAEGFVLLPLDWIYWVLQQLKVIIYGRRLKMADGMWSGWVLRWYRQPPSPISYT